MRVTWAGHLDLDLTSQATCADICDFLAEHSERPANLWCGDVRLDSDHRAGVPPLTHGAALTADPGFPLVSLKDPHVAVIAGPDAGWMLPLTRTGSALGRSAGADLTLRDDSMSHSHVSIGMDKAPWARDLGSRNGSLLMRANGRRRRGRAVHPGFGDLMVAGESVMEFRPIPSSDDARANTTPSALSGQQWAAVAGGAASGIVLASITGRWYFALIALVYPTAMLAPWVIARLRTIAGPSDEYRGAFDPCPHAEADSVGAAGPDSIGALKRVPTGSIAVTGPSTIATATARAILLARQTRPATSDWEEPWMRWLPRADPGDAVLVVPEGQDAPSWARTVVDARTHSTQVRAGTVVVDYHPCWVSAQAAESVARIIASRAQSRALPREVGWADVATTSTHHTGGAPAFATAVGVGADGAVSIDLDTHGPHLLVAGTTGAGKSALLETFVLGLAHRVPPTKLNIALIDFKGGAGLRHCMDLPHVVGSLTDLDGHLAQRALVALSTELEDRKRSVAAAGYGSFAEWEVSGGAPPRLLVVADEYQEIAQHHREFLPDLARLAAQGRSLGLHLVLATQRPAGAVTPEIRANVSTTIALRVTSASESQDLIGNGDASLLPQSIPGRAIVSHGTARHTIQVARPSVMATPVVRLAGTPVEGSASELASAVALRWQGAAPPRALWCDPLPERQSLPPAAARNPRRSIVVGLADWPSQRKQDFVAWVPTEGPLAVVGPHGSGRTTTLRALAAQAHQLGLAPVWLPLDPREAARTIVLADSRRDVLLLIDDAGVLVPMLADCDLGAAADALVRRLARAEPTVLALAPHDSARLAGNPSQRIVFTGTDDADDSLWGVPRSLSGISPRPGLARWGSRGAWCELQACVPPSDSPDPAVLVTPLPNAASVADRCASDPRLLGVGGDGAMPIHLGSGAITIAGRQSRERDAIEAHVRSVANATGLTVTVNLRDDLLSLPGVARPRGTIIVSEPGLRSIRDAAGTPHVGIADPFSTPGRVAVITDSAVIAVQMPWE